MGDGGLRVVKCDTKAVSIGREGRKRERERKYKRNKQTWRDPRGYKKDIRGAGMRMIGSGKKER